jgi:hypothetical protein
MLLQAGSAIVAHNRIGTLGALVTSARFPGALFLLTAYHVLDDKRGDGSVTLRDTNTVIAQYIAGPGTTDAEMDAAIARITIAEPFANFSNEVPSGNFRITHPGGPMKPQDLVKFGAGTNETTCAMAAILNEFDRRRGYVELGQASAGLQNYSAPGDSGALWCDKVTGLAIAMHIQGDRPGNMAIASTMNFIMERLQLTFAQPPSG